MLNKFSQRKTKKSRKYTYSPKKSIREEEVAVYRKLSLTAVLVIGFAISLYLWGIPLVVKLGDFWDNFGTQDTTPSPTSSETDALISPRLNPRSACSKNRRVDSWQQLLLDVYDDLNSISGIC